jgi:hypothetical protein
MSSYSYMHTHTHICARILYICMYNTYTYACIHVLYIHMYIRTCVCIHTHIHIRAQTSSQERSFHIARPERTNQTTVTCLRAILYSQWIVKDGSRAYVLMRGTGRGASVCIYVCMHACMHETSLHSVHYIFVFCTLAHTHNMPVMDVKEIKHCFRIFILCLSVLSMDSEAGMFQPRGE